LLVRGFHPLLAEGLSFEFPGFALNFRTPEVLPYLRFLFLSLQRRQMRLFALFPPSFLLQFLTPLPLIFYKIQNFNRVRLSGSLNGGHPFMPRAEKTFPPPSFGQAHSKYELRPPHCSRTLLSYSLFVQSRTNRRNFFPFSLFFTLSL